MMVVGCMANRQIARALNCSPTTVAHHIARLGRQCLLVQAGELTRLPDLAEIAIDGFETFEWSQYFPFHHNVAVDVESGYFLYHTDSPLRRKGRMTTHQKARRESLEQALGGTLTHRATSSKQRRDERNPLREINVLDLMIRHSTAAHKRERIAWAKRGQASIEKLTIFQVWRNYIKRRRKKGARVTPAMLLGVASRPWRLQDLLKERMFFGRTTLSPRWQQYYRRAVETRALAVNRTHDLRYAF